VTFEFFETFVTELIFLEVDNEKYYFWLKKVRNFGKISILKNKIAKTAI